MMMNGSSLKVGKEYNPITDLALNCAARDKYRAEVEYSGNVKKGDGQIWIKHKYSVYFSAPSDVTHSVIECILKSEGVWVDG